MLKGKLKLPDKARRVFPDRLGSLVAGLDDKEDENGVFESGEELEIMQPNGADLGRKMTEFQSEFDEENQKMTDKEEARVRKKLDKDGLGQVSVTKVIAEVEKRSDLHHELSQNEINLEKLRRIASKGLPEGVLRATTWKLLLGYLPPSRDLWEKEVTENRQKYAKLKEELLTSPCMLKVTFLDPLKRHGISHEEQPLSVGKASPWH